MGRIRSERIGHGLTLHTLAGSLYGYRLLWVPATATLLMIVYTWLCGRLALVTGRTLFDLVRARWGGAAARMGGVFASLAVLAFQSGNSAGVAFADEAYQDRKIGYTIVGKNWAIYQTADGKWVAVGSTEHTFYVNTLKVLGLDPADFGDQHDRAAGGRRPGEQHLAVVDPEAQLVAAQAEQAVPALLAAGLRALGPV